MKIPAKIAVIIPLDGGTPDAIEKASAKGRATRATISPLIVSLLNFDILYPYHH